MDSRHSLWAHERDDQRGASAVEYGLLVAAIAGIIAFVVFAFGNIVKDTFDVTCDAISGEAQSVDATCS